MHSTVWIKQVHINILTFLEILWKNKVDILDWQYNHNLEDDVL